MEEHTAALVFVYVVLCTWIIHTMLTYLKMLMDVRVWLYTAV